jgi:molybdopterin synthase catalytic subunit
MISVRIQSGVFDGGAECAALRRDRTDIGALVSFTGLVRDMPMTLEHYPALAQRQLEALAASAQARWPLLGGTIIHRYGRLLPGEEIVLVAIASAHRSAAFEAASYLMDWLKTRAPFWKLEERDGSPCWVEARAEDETAAARWG